ncbi:MAG: sugar phosphate isomerase/epimerase family protein [Thermomicrobiales bacterium]
MRLSCGEQLLGERPLAEKIALVREAGFDGIDLRWSTLQAADTRAALAAGGLPVGAIYSQLREPGLLSRHAAERATALDQAVKRAHGAADAGAACLILVPIFKAALLRAFPPVADLDTVETSLLLTALDELAARLADVPITVVLEPLNHGESHFLTDPTRAAALCAAIGSPRIATMVDTYHCDREGQDSAAQSAAVGDHLSLVHLSDSDRQLPGEGSIIFGPLLAALRQRGYGGWLGYECRPVTDQAALARSVRRMRALWANAANGNDVATEGARA